MKYKVWYIIDAPSDNENYNIFISDIGDEINTEWEIKNSTVPIIQTVLGIVVSLIDNKLCQYKSQVTFKNRTKWCKNKEATRIKLF